MEGCDEEPHTSVAPCHLVLHAVVPRGLFNAVSVINRTLSMVIDQFATFFCWSILIAELSVGGCLRT